MRDGERLNRLSDLNHAESLRLNRGLATDCAWRRRDTDGKRPRPWVSTFAPVNGAVAKPSDVAPGYSVCTPRVAHNNPFGSELGRHACCTHETPLGSDGGDNHDQRTHWTIGVSVRARGCAKDAHTGNDRDYGGKTSTRHCRCTRIRVCNPQRRPGFVFANHRAHIALREDLTHALRCVRSVEGAGGWSRECRTAFGFASERSDPCWGTDRSRRRARTDMWADLIEGGR
jgi:hypothetical protein